MSRSEICDDSLVLAAVCCWTLTSAASARCISVFLSGLSSKFLQSTHLHMEEHMILAFGSNRGNTGRWTGCLASRRRYSRGRTDLVALAVVLQAAWSLAVAAFAVPAVWLALFPFADLRLEGLRVPVQAGLRRNRFAVWFDSLRRSWWGSDSGPDQWNNF